MNTYKIYFLRNGREYVKTIRHKGPVIEDGALVFYSLGTVSYAFAKGAWLNVEVE